MPSCLKIFSGCLLFLLFVGASVFAEEYTFDYQKILQIEEPVSLDLSNIRGSVSIAGSENDRVIVEAVKQIYAASEEEAQAVFSNVEIKVNRSGQKVTVQTNYLPLLGYKRSFWQKLIGSGDNACGEVHYTIAVPTGTDVKISGIETDISLSSIEGEINIINETGTTVGEFLFGPISIQQPNGTIDLQWVNGDVRIKSTSGEITINQVQGSIDVTTRTSNVNIRTELDSPRDFFVHTSSGSITFTIPELSSGLLNIETASGAISTDVPIAIQSMTHHTVVGEFGSGGPKINISSSTGDVRVAQF